MTDTRHSLRALAGLVALALAPSLSGCAEDASGDNDNEFELLSTPGTEAQVGSKYTYQLLWTLAAGPKVFELEQAPAGMTVSSAGLVEWTPAYGDLGSHQVQIEASTLDESATQSFVLRVAQGLVLGTTLSPRGHLSMTSAQDLVDYYSGHAAYGRVIAFHGNWRDDLASAGAIPTFAADGLTAAATYGFTPVIGIGWTDPAGAPDLDGQTDPTDSWFNAETRAEFVGMVTQLVTDHELPYLFLGHETNTYWLTHAQAEWDEWIDVFGEAYLSIKAASPETLVYTVFQLERMQGLGVNAGWSDPAHFQLVADHGTLIDALGFTSYPYFEYASPAAIPAGHYDEIASHWSGPVVLAELGWLASPEGAFPGGLGDQNAFVATCFDRTRGLDLEAVVWRFLHDFEDPAALPGFGSIGLRTNDGLTVRPVEASWQSEVALRQRPD